MKIFAYGSNMCSKRLKKRISSAKFVAKGFVKRHKIAFHKTSKDGSGKADCYFTGNAQDKVWGVVLEITDDEKIILDKYEGLGDGYTEKTIDVICEGKIYKTQVYIAESKHIDDSLKPYDWYLNYVIGGAQEFCLPLPYIENILKRIVVTIDSDSTRRKKNMKMLNNDDLRMGGFTIGQWRLMRERIKDTTEYNQDWDQAVRWFIQRLNKRYFSPLNKISKGLDGAGFTVTSILCALIEHLAAVKEGKIYNYLQNRQSPKYEYKHSRELYTDFLEHEEIFKSYFYMEDGSPSPFCADDFYKNVRCALLHEACIKNNWKIKVSNGQPNDAMIVKDKDCNKVIYRDVLQRKITTVYIKSYVEDLKGDLDLRRKFARKMDSLCELTPDRINYEWWVDK